MGNLEGSKPLMNKDYYCRDWTLQRLLWYCQDINLTCVLGWRWSCEWCHLNFCPGMCAGSSSTVHNPFLASDHSETKTDPGALSSDAGQTSSTPEESPHPSPTNKPKKCTLHFCTSLFVKSNAVWYLSTVLRIQFIKLCFHPLSSFPESVLQPFLYGDRCLTLLFRRRERPTRSCREKKGRCDRKLCIRWTFKLSNEKFLINLTFWWTDIKLGKG